MINIHGYEKNGFTKPIGAEKKDLSRSGGKDKSEKTRADGGHYDKADFSSFLGKTDNTEGTKSGIRVGAATEKTKELSQTAKDYLEKLKKKYGNMDFIIADYSTDEEADQLLAKGKGEYNVLITPDLLEKMAADESAAAEYEGLIEQSVENIDGIKEGLGEDADMVDKYGVTIDSDGNVSLRVKLIEGLTANDGSNTIKATTVEEMLEHLKSVKEEQAEKLAEIREKRAQEATADTDDVDDEVEELKDKKNDIMAQIRAEQNEDKKSELELLLGKLDTELSAKDNENYRRGHARFDAHG